MKKQHVGLSIGVLAGLAALAFVYYRWHTSGFAWAEFEAVLVGIDLSWMALGLAGVLATYVGRALRWELMLRPLRPDADLWRILSATCIGFTAMVLFGRAGEPVRPFLIAKQNNVSFSSQLAAWLVERILDLLMVLLMFGVALSQIRSIGASPSPGFQLILEASGYAAGFTGLVCLGLIIALRHFRGRVRERLMEALAFLPDSMRLKVNQFVVAFEEGMQSTRQASYIWKLVGYTVAEWGIVVASFYCVMRSFSVTSSFGWNAVMVVLGFTAFGSAVQIPGVGGGMQIAATVVLTQLFGLTLEAASGIALVLWLVNFVSIVPVGLALAFHEGIRWRNLKKIAEDSTSISL